MKQHVVNELRFDCICVLIERIEMWQHTDFRMKFGDANGYGNVMNAIEIRFTENEGKNRTTEPTEWATNAGPFPTVNHPDLGKIST